MRESGVLLAYAEGDDSLVSAPVLPYASFNGLRYAGSVLDSAVWSVEADAVSPRWANTLTRNSRAATTASRTILNSNRTLSVFPNSVELVASLHVGVTQKGPRVRRQAKYADDSKEQSGCRSDDN